MPATTLALRLEQTYGQAVGVLWRRVVAIVSAQLATVDPDALELGFRRFLPIAAEAIAAGQRDAQQLAQAFVVSYVETETGRAYRAAPMAAVAGTTRDGAGLRTALSGAVGVTWFRITQGAAPAEALLTGRAYLERLTSLAVSDAAEREVEHQADRSRGLLPGWTWQVVGRTCVACLDQQTGEVRRWSERGRRHPGCDCVRVPVPVGVFDEVSRPTGIQLFDQMTPSQQAAIFKADGEAKAATIRAGSASFSDFAGTDRTAAGTVITEAA